LTVQPTSAVAGQAVTLTWYATSAATCTAGNAWSGAEPTGGLQSVTAPAAGTATYMLTCKATGASGNQGVASATATLTVTAATEYVFKAVAANTAGAAATVDANLEDSWGLLVAPNSALVVFNHGSQAVTFYDGNGTVALDTNGQPIVFKMPAGASGNPFNPTMGQVNPTVSNSSPDFNIIQGSAKMPALLLSVGDLGAVAGTGYINPVTTEIAFQDTGGAVYKSVALSNNGAGNFLYATDFHNNKIDVFDGTFARQTPSTTRFAFVDPNLPAGYAPFGIQTLPTGASGALQIYVTYAKQAGPGQQTQMNGAGLGILDVFDLNGNFVRTLVPAGGALNAPWGVALAPVNFGTFSRALLVSNHGDGLINGFDPGTGRFLGALVDASGGPRSQDGLWGIAFGNNAKNQPANTLFYTAGPNGGADGLLGRIDLPTS